MRTRERHAAPSWPRRVATPSGSLGFNPCFPCYILAFDVFRPDFHAHTLIIIPAYNEIEKLPLVLLAPEVLDLDLEILVVDGGPPDGTGVWVGEPQAWRPRLHLLKHSGKQGLGSAYVAGFKYALDHGYEGVFDTGAGLQDNPSELSGLQRRLDDGADMVAGWKNPA